MLILLADEELKIPKDMIFEIHNMKDIDFPSFGKRERTYPTLREGLRQPHIKNRR